MTTGLRLSAMSGLYAICRLDADAPIPLWAIADDFFSITRTADELSIVCADSSIPDGVKCERGWRCLKVEGPLDFSLTGILSSLVIPLARAEVSIFAVSTFDTDYLLVRDLDRAKSSLIEAGHLVV